MIANAANVSESAAAWERFEEHHAVCVRCPAVGEVVHKGRVVYGNCPEALALSDEHEAAAYREESAWLNRFYPLGRYTVEERRAAAAHYRHGDDCDGSCGCP